MNPAMFLILVAVLIYFVYWFKKQAKKPPTVTEQPTVTLETRGSTGLASDTSLPKRHVNLEPTDNGVIFNATGRLPIRIHHVGEEDLRDIVEGIRTHTPPYELKEQLGLLFAQRNAESPEVESFLAEVHKKYDPALQTELQKEPGYLDWPKADREDFEAEARHSAANGVAICTQYEDLTVLMHERPSDLTTDDAITTPFADDVQGLRRYLRLCGRNKPTQAYDPEDRKVYERLVSSGLAVRGLDLAVETLLEQLRMKDIQRILGQDAPKKFTRKADAIAHAAQVEGIRERIAEEIPLRSIYQATEPPGDLDAAAQAFRFATEYGGLIITTLITESQARRNAKEAKRFEVNGEQCFLCDKYSGKEVTKRSQLARPPHHVGCTCDFFATEIDL